jgi:hypothetical protein
MTTEVNEYEIFWNTRQKKGGPNQLQRYEAKNSPAPIKRFIELGGGSSMGVACEEFARHRFSSLQKRAKGKDQTGYDHLLTVGDCTFFVEQKSSGHWGEDDYKWQHVEEKHKWNVLLLCGIDYTAIHFWTMNRTTFQQLVNAGKIKNQGNKAADSSEGVWFDYSAVKEHLTPIHNDADLIAFVSQIA